MKLNNKGWGTTEMILLSTGLFIALLVAIFFIGKLYGSLDNAVHNSSYLDLENNIESAARNYIVDNNLNVYNGEIIHKNTLTSSGYLIDLKDKFGNDCNGYVKVSIIDYVTYYNGYISCPDYQTNNY